MLERHIMQAQARAMSSDERELNKATMSCDNYSTLGLPPGLNWKRFEHLFLCMINHILSLAFWDSFFVSEAIHYITEKLKMRQ